MHNFRNGNSYEIIRQGTKELNAQTKERILQASNLKGNIRDRLGLWVYKHHLLVAIHLFPLITLLAFINHFVNTVPLINLYIEESVFKGIGYIIIVIYEYSVIPLILITQSRFEVSKIERDYFIRNYYLDKTGLTIDKARRKLEKDLSSCKSKTVWLYGILSFLYLMIANGLSSGTDFQNALRHLSLDKMYELNLSTGQKL